MFFLDYELHNITCNMLLFYILYTAYNGVYYFFITKKKHFIDIISRRKKLFVKIIATYTYMAKF